MPAHRWSLHGHPTRVPGARAAWRAADYDVLGRRVFEPPL